MLSKEELLVPRFKVIADFPYNPFNIGQILTPFFVEDSPNIKKWYVQNNYDYSWINVEEYPAIFKKLEWWEDRSFEELPEYVKNADGVYKTYFSIPSKNGSLWEWQVVHPTKEYGAEIMYILDNQMEPSTKEEYEKTN